MYDSNFLAYIFILVLKTLIIIITIIIIIIISGNWVEEIDGDTDGKEL
jgi:hypothetical protein